MKDEKPLQARDRLLNLFIDGEMSSEKAAEYRTEVLAEDLSAQAEHQELLAVRREIRNYSAEQSASLLTDIKSEQLWQRIENEIQREVEKPLPWWQRFSISGPFSVPSIGLATACALAAFVVGVQFGNNGKSKVLNAKSQIANTFAGTNQNLTEHTLVGSTLAKLSSFSTNASSQEDMFKFKLKSKDDGFHREIVVASTQGGVLHRVPIELDTNQLIGVNQNIALRAHGVDIDWIKSDRPYRLVAAGKSVPVIWISGAK